MKVKDLADKLVARGQSLSTVESCTGGGIAALCTDVSGSSEWFLGGVVTYSNDMKIRLGVDADAIENYGAVSESVAIQMAEQGRHYCRSDWTIAVTGIAGPGGGGIEKPVGTVWIAWANAEKTVAKSFLFKGDRAGVRAQTAETAISQLIDFLN